MRPITDDMQKEIEELRDTVETLRRQGRDMPVMTLREHYAGLAMQGLLASEVNVSWQDFADMSIRAADALIAALEATDA